METHSALELIVLPIVRGVGGAVAFFALLKLIHLGIRGIARGIRRRRRIAAQAAGPYRPARPRIVPANGRVAPIAR